MVYIYIKGDSVDYLWQIMIYTIKGFGKIEKDNICKYIRAVSIYIYIYIY